MTTPRRTTIAAVSYLNTIPFLYGIRHSDALSAGLLLSPPSGCARDFASGEADIALVPVGGLGSIGDFDIVTDWCIGASGPVRTVVMVSDVPLHEIRRVWMDSHSMTSVRLAQVLAKNQWKISPEWVDLEWPSLDNNSSAPLPPFGGRCEFATANSGDAYILIGDKVFEREGRFKYTWDLAEEWEKYARLPFVFAVWVARKTVPEDTLAALESALTLGVERVYEAIAESEFADRPYAYDYLTRNIDYFFDTSKRAALDKFLAENNKLKTLPAFRPVR